MFSVTGQKKPILFVNFFFLILNGKNGEKVYGEDP